jgi:hypothetical protein
MCPWISQGRVPRISFAASLATQQHDPADVRHAPRHAAPEKTFWALLPRRNFRRALFLIAALIAIIVIKRMGGFSLAKLFNDVAPPPAPAQQKQQRPFQHLEVKP